MLDMILFAVIFVAVQMIGGFIMMNLIMSGPFMKMYMKKMFKLMKSLEDDIEDLI